MSREGRKELLFKAAFKLFVTKQFDGVSISDIEKETGLTRGAVFYYADTKRDLYEMVMRHYMVKSQDVRRKVHPPSNAHSWSTLTIILMASKRPWMPLFPLLMLQNVTEPVYNLRP